MKITFGRGIRGIGGSKRLTLAAGKVLQTANMVLIELFARLVLKLSEAGFLDGEVVLERFYADRFDPSFLTPLT